MRLISLKLTRPLWGLAAVTTALLVAVACGNGSGEPQATETIASQSRGETAPAVDPSPAISAPIQDQPANAQTRNNGIQPVKAETPEAPAAQSPAPTIDSSDNAKVGGAVGDRAPEFKSVSNWINSNPLTMESLRGQVVLIDFWTYTCINCIRTFPFLRD